MALPRLKRFPLLLEYPYHRSVDEQNFQKVSLDEALFALQT